VAIRFNDDGGRVTSPPYHIINILLLLYPLFNKYFASPLSIIPKVENAWMILHFPLGFLDPGT
jgi:hypothetical protein